MKKEFDSIADMDEDDVGYVLGHNPEQTHITLTVVSKRQMTGEEYLAILASFVERSMPESNLIFTDKFSHITDIH